MIDTGATVNLLRWKEAVAMGMKAINAREVTQLSGISGRTLETLGTCQLDLVIRGVSFPTKFHLIQEIALPGLLGAEFLHNYGVNISYSGGYSTLNPQQLTKDGQVELRLEHKEERHEKVIKVEIIPDNIMRKKEVRSEEMQPEKEEDSKDAIVHDKIEPHTGEIKRETKVDNEIQCVS